METFSIVNIGVAVISEEERERRKSLLHHWRFVWRSVALMKVV
jgi:hypothetical protein